MKINGIVRLCIIAVSMICSVLTSFAQADGLTFEVIEPKVNSVISKAPMTIEISFRSPIDVNSFEAYIDSKLLIKGNLRTPMPNGHFALPANYQNLRLTPGKHFFTVKLFDILGKVAQRTVGITLQNSIVAEKNPPTVVITNPKNGAVIEKNEDVQITIDANDDSGIKWVLVYINDDVRAMMNTAPYIAPWNPMKENFKAGTYLITAKAIDLFENPATSKPVTVTYKPFSRTEIINAYDPIATGTSLIPTLGSAYNRATAIDFLAASWASGIPYGLPPVATPVTDNRLLAMGNNSSNKQFPQIMRITPADINETIAGSPVMALSMAPALAALPGMINPMSVNGYTYTPMFSALPAPASEISARNGITETPIATKEAMSSKTATSTTVNNPAITTSQTVAQQPTADTMKVPQQDIKIAKGTFTGSPANLNVIGSNETRVSDSSNPMMIAKLPGKVATGIESGKVDGVVNTTTITGNAPSTGSSSSKPANNTTDSTLSRPAANAPIVENSITSKNIQSVSPVITNNNPARVKPAVTTTTNNAVDTTVATGNTPATIVNSSKPSNTSSSTLTRPGVNTPVWDNNVSGKNITKVAPAITTNNPTRVTHQETAPVADSVTVATITGNTPATIDSSTRPANSSSTTLTRPGSNAPVIENGTTGKNIQSATPGINTNSNPARVTPKIPASVAGTTDIANSTAISPEMKNDNVKPTTIANGLIAPTRSNVTVGEKNGVARSVATAIPTVKGSSSKISPQAIAKTGTVENVIANSTNVTPANPTVNQQTVDGQKVTTRGDLGNPSTIATGGRNTGSSTPDVKIATAIKTHGQPTIGIQTPATVVTNTSTAVNPTVIDNNVSKGTVNSTNVTTRGDLGNPSSIATGGRNTESTTPDVKVTTAVKPHGQPTIAGQSPATVVTNTSTAVNPTVIDNNVSKGTVNSTNVTTRGDINNPSTQTTGSTRNNGTATPDVKITNSQRTVPTVNTQHTTTTTIVNSGTTVKPTITGGVVTKENVTGTNIAPRNDIKNIVANTTTTNRTSTSYQPVIKTDGIQNRISSPVTSNRNPIIPKVISTPVTIDVYATYVSGKNDTLQKIAKINNTTESALLKDNKGLNPKSAIKEGTAIKIKQPAATLYVDNNRITGYPTPMLVNGAAMVPFRAVIEAKDGTVVWIADTKEVNAWLAANKAFIKMKIGDKTATVNNQVVNMKNAPRIEKSRTMVEVEYLATAMNLEYKYNELSNTYYFVSKK